MRQRFWTVLLFSLLISKLLIGEESTIIRGDVIVRPVNPRTGDIKESLADVPVDYNFQKQIIDGTLGICYGIAVDGLDQDSDLDIIVSEPYDLKIHLFENISTPDTIMFEKSLIYEHVKDSANQVVGSIFQVALADLDNDTNIDIVFSQEDEGLYVLYNEGQASFSDTVKISSKITWMFEVIDLNEDGLMDIVGNNNSWNTEVWYIKQGTDKSFSEHLIDNDCGDAYGLDVVDLDSDGDLDIVQGSINWYDDLYWYENNGEENFTKRIIDEFIDDPLDIVCTDMDKDNDVDIVVPAYGAGELRWYENNGSEQFNINTITDSVDGMWHIETADMDSNQTTDILTGNRNSDYLLWFSIDSAGFYSTHQIDSSIQYPQDFVIQDFNSDNKPDIALVSGHSAWGEYTGGQLALYFARNKTGIPPNLNESLPRSVILHQNYPNPFNPLTTIAFDLPSEAHVTLKIFDLMGREIATLMDERRIAGHHEALFDASKLASGLYLYQIQASDFSRIRKLIVTK
ncbi:T9SS type A sorting domain-containing protein [candidate division KSB1 bacterium]|nr:T9SS type A sorting domain-containing protein [candidate division KSB1 bacterium]